MSKKENSKETYPFPSNVVFFATGNIHKFNEVRSILAPLGFAVAMLRMKGDEIQSDSIKDIAQNAVANAFKQIGLPIFVEDAGLFITALEGFPGPYAAYVFKTIHNKGILKLMQGEADRHAQFQSVIAYLDSNQYVPQCFFGESKGAITQTERIELGKSSFGFDPIFLPDGNSKTFAEMTIEEKNHYSHRAMAIRKFANWHKQSYVKKRESVHVHK
jgi:XTP/dITP diphosphohydrolase